MKIVYSVGVSLGGGGIGDTANYAVKEIYKEKVLMRVLCLENKQKVIPLDKIITTKWTKYPLRYPLRAIQKYIFKNFDSYYWTDYIHDFFTRNKIPKCDIFHYWKSHGEISSIKARKMGAIILVESASSHPLTFKKIMEEEYHRLNIPFRVLTKKNIKKQLRELNNADYVVIPTDFVEQSFLENEFPKEKLIKTPFGVDLDIYSDKKEKKDEKFRAIFVGQVSIRKGIHYLLQAWEELKLKNAELVIVGNICGDARKFVEKYSSNKTIKFTGFDDPKKYYKQSDVFVFPSIEEGSALVTYEAMASGLPLIATFNSGSVAREGKDGFIIPIRDVKELKAKIKFMQDNPIICDKMGKSARKYMEKFPWENYGKNILKAYKRILKK